MCACPIVYCLFINHMKHLKIKALSVNPRLKKLALSFYLQSSLVDLPLKNYYRYVIPTLVCQSFLFFVVDKLSPLDISCSPSHFANFAG